MKLFLSLFLCWTTWQNSSAFVPLTHRVSSPTTPSFGKKLAFLSASQDDEEEKTENPYADPNYPDLEFVNYDDPEYQVDQGVSDDLFSASDAETLKEIEAMREERRRRNDEFQFETYFKEVLKDGDEYKGEWTVYRTSTFLPGGEMDSRGLPKFNKSKQPMKVISNGFKIKVDTDSDWRVDGERICHLERLIVDPDSEPLEEDIQQLQEEILGKTYWPKELSANDFRGPQGIMCVGNTYTLCHGLALDEHRTPTSTDSVHGPFADYRAEIGIFSDDLRFRIKLDYSVKEDEREEYLETVTASEESPPSPPPLHLKTMTVCRETQQMWPREGTFRSDPLFAGMGALGGLYDPPPVGTEDQARCYMLLDLEGGASVLLPYVINQADDAFDGNGWVTTLDWTPGKIRYQVDRKVTAGSHLLGLRTLELSEVQGEDADLYRPRDGGADMRQ